MVFNVGSDFRAVDSKTTSHSPSISDPHVHSKIIDSLAQVGFLNVKQYSENLTGFPNPRSFIVAFSDDYTARNWNRNEAQINHVIRDRSRRTKSGNPPMEFFDGSTMASYSRFEQDADNCKLHPDPSWCDIHRQLMMAQHRFKQLPGELNVMNTCMDTPSDSNASVNADSQCMSSEPDTESRWSNHQSVDHRHYVASYDS